MIKKIKRVAAKSLSLFGNIANYTVYLDANLCNPRSDKRVWQGV